MPKRVEQKSDEYLVTGKPGIYARPNELQGWVTIKRSVGRESQQVWTSNLQHEHLDSVDLIGRHGIRIPGIMIVPDELEYSLEIGWMKPDGEDIDIRITGRTIRAMEAHYDQASDMRVSSENDDTE
jgi:hypothetical protein